VGEKRTPWGFIGKSGVGSGRCGRQRQMTASPKHWRSKERVSGFPWPRFRQGVVIDLGDEFLNGKKKK